MAERRETSVVVVEFESGEFFLITSLATQRDTQVIWIDPTTGALGYSGRPGVDLFPSEVDALQWLAANSRGLSKGAVYGKAILGYAALGNVALLLIAIKVRASIPDLPGGDSVHTVVESKWLKIPLRNPQPLLKGEMKNASDLTDIAIDNTHFFCETRDITRPFPSPRSVHSPDEEFAWNLWLSSPFKAIGLPHHCVVLLQGLADSRTFTSYEGQQLTIALTARRSRLHPGTRYLARGLNAAFSTGNEVECEQLVWPHVAPGHPIPFAVYTWRRGTVPLWWGAEIKSNLAEAEIFVSEHRTYEGSSQYYKRLGLRYGRAASEGAEKQKKSPLVCINLLRNGIGKPEVVLWQHFEDSIKFVKSQGELNEARVFLLNYDWHDKVKTIGEPKTVEGLWQLLKDPSSDIKFDLGEYYEKGQQPKDFAGSLAPNRGANGGAFRVSKKQEGVVRFNCADSLDRTNAASFFGAIQVLAEQCRQLGYPLDSGRIMPSRSLAEGSEGTLPPGWERRADAVTGRTFYIDHNTRRTTWDHPSPEITKLDKPWTRFDMTVDEFKESTLSGAIAGMAELFLIAGDIHATLYTGSKAMHSHIIQIFGEDGGKAKTLSPAQNLAITLQRRFLNVVMDSSRQKQLEMFLGLRLNKNFPTLPDQPLQVLTRPNACLLKPVPSMFPNAIPQNALISAKYKDIVWVSPSAAEVVELYIFLSEPCHASQLLLTVAHGIDDLTSPTSFDVRAGRHLDTLKLVLEGATIPRCANGAQLLYLLPGARNEEDVAITGAGAGGNDFSWLYNFEEQESELDFLTRIVVLTFYPAVPGIPMTLGEVEVLGISLFSGRISKNAGQQLLGSQASSNPRRDSVSPGKIPMNFLSAVSDQGNSQVTLTRGPGLVNTGLDLLSDVFHSPPQPTSLSGTGGAGLTTDLMSWDPFETPPIASTSSFTVIGASPVNSVGPEHSRTQAVLSNSSLKLKGDAERYLELLGKILRSNTGGSVHYQEAMELEIARLSLNLSAAERDRALLSVGRDPATLDPNRLLTPNDLAQVRQTASQLAVSSHIAAEDKDSAAIGFEMEVQPSSVEGDDEVLKECCSHSECEVVFRKKVSGSVKTSPLSVCHSCKKRTCTACKAGDGSGLLLNLGGTGLGASANSGPSRGPPPIDAVICLRCCPSLIQNALLLDRVKVLASVRRKIRVKAALSRGIAEVTALGFGSDSTSSPASSGQESSSKLSGHNLKSLYKGLTSLAEYPFASLLSSVSSAEGSEPAQSLIASLNAGPTRSYWKLSPGITSVDLAIVLSAPSLVSGIILVVSSCGYSPQDAPLIDFWCSNTVAETERVSLGRWDIAAAASSASENIYGPEPAQTASSAVPRHILFKLRSPVRCRILWARISVLNSAGLPIDLLGSPPRGPSAPLCIHAKRLLVLGRPLIDDTDSLPPSLGPDRVSMKTVLDTPARMARLKVQTESERSAAGGRMVQLFFPPIAPGISGFRLDAPGAVKVAARYASSASTKLRQLDRVLGSSIDEAVTNAVVLQISVSAVQGDAQAPVPVGTYLLPTTRPGTPLYFDFGQTITVRILVFELLGDVSAFTDENVDQGDSGDAKEFALAASLSLANKVRPYRQVNAAELGKWPQVNAI